MNTSQGKKKKKKRGKKKDLKDLYHLIFKMVWMFQQYTFGEFLCSTHMKNISFGVEVWYQAAMQNGAQ